MLLQFIFLWGENKLGRGVGIMFEIISKDEAKRRLDESPCNDVLWRSIDKNYVHKKRKIKKSEGKKLISRAKEVAYQNNDFFGTLSFEIIEDKKREISIIQSILFPQKNTKNYHE